MKRWLESDEELHERDVILESIDFGSELTFDDDEDEWTYDILYCRENRILIKYYLTVSRDIEFVISFLKKMKTSVHITHTIHEASLNNASTQALLCERSSIVQLEMIRFLGSILHESNIMITNDLIKWKASFEVIQWDKNDYTNAYLLLHNNCFKMIVDELISAIHKEKFLHLFLFFKSELSDIPSIDIISIIYGEMVNFFYTLMNK